MINFFKKHAFSFCSFIKVISINLIKLYFKATDINDPDKNSLEFISRLPVELEIRDKMYLSEWKGLFGSCNKSYVK